MYIPPIYVGEKAPPPLSIIEKVGERFFLPVIDSYGLRVTILLLNNQGKNS